MRIIRLLPVFAFLGAGTLLAFALALTAPVALAQPGEPIHNDMAIDFAGSWAAAPVPPVAPVPTIAAGMPQWSILIAMVLTIMAASLRRFTFDSHWFHSSNGMWAVATAAGLLEALASTIEHGGLTWWALAFGGCQFLLSALAMSKPAKRDPAVVP